MKRALRFLPTFVAVLESGGVRAAASILHKTQAAISYDLKQLQDTVGVPLLARSGRGLRPTEAGKRLLRASRRMLDELSAALHEPATELEPLRIAAVSGFGRYVAHDTLLACAGARSLELRFFTNEEVMARVRTGDAELGFCFARRPSRTLLFKPFYRERMVLIVPPAWRLPTASDAWKGALGDQRVVSYDESDFVFARWFSALFGDPRRKFQQGDHYTELEEVVRAVSAGRGFSVVPFDSADALKRITPVRIVETRPVVENVVYAVCRADRTEALSALPGQSVR
jgi:DNA-binding transcriptional LysR family regulator